MARPLLVPKLQSTVPPGDMAPPTCLPEMPLQRRPPWHELKAKTIVDHGEAAGGQRDTLPIDAGDVLAVGGWPMNQARLGREPCRRFVQLPLPQGVEQIAREDDTLSLAPRQPFPDKMIDAPVHRFAHLSAERVAARGRLSRQS